MIIFKSKGQRNFFGLIIFAITFFIFFFKSNLFAIKKIDVVKNNIPCATENQLQNSLGLTGKNFFLLDVKDTQVSLKSKYICIKDVKLSRILPNKIKLEVIGRIPWVSLIQVKNIEASGSSIIENIATPSATQIDEVLTADMEGVVFLKNNFINNIPKIYVYNILQNDYLKKSLKILQYLKIIGMDNTETNIINNFLITNSIPRVIFKLDQDLSLQIASLQLILQRAKIDSKELEFIDLRFDKPIVKFAPKKN